MPKVAAITMAFDESDFLPIWARHYARQVGADHCYVIDHGSTYAVKLPPGINVMRIPRSPHDDVRRAAFMVSFASSLLAYYDWVIHTDVDEIVIADPEDYSNLTAYCAAEERDTVTAAGFDVQHIPSIEQDLDVLQSIGHQRSWVRFTSAMCKPVLTRKLIKWSPGFHTSDAELVFRGLYLFHLHWADRKVGLRRLAKTRTMPWSGGGAGAHQRISDREWNSLFDGMAALPQRSILDLKRNKPPLADWLQQTSASMQPRRGEPATLNLAINASELWAIPARFRTRL